MAKYFYRISYKGTRYSGWQTQSDQRTIQETIERAFAQMLSRDNYHIHGCGRTDKGVHASEYFAHGVVEKAVDERFLYSINRILPSDIRIHEIIPVHPRANAQLDAQSRTYHYYVHWRESPFLQSTSRYIESIDLEKLPQIQQLLVGRHDFRSFCLKPDQHDYTEVEMMDFGFKQLDEHRGYFCFRANRFLRAMIRILMHEILLCLAGQKDMGTMERQLAHQEPLQFMKQIEPHGLFLAGVEYPDRVFVTTL